MSKKRIKQFLVGLLAVLSLSVSSVGACGCTHHEEAPKEEVSCHGKSKSQHEKKNSNDLKTPSAGESCLCVQPAAKASVKVEGFKLKKQPALFTTGVDLEPARFRAVERPVTSLDVIPIAARSFLDSSSSRGPPVS